MDVDIKTEATNTENDGEVKIESPVEILSSPDLITPQIPSKSTDDITNSASKQNNGNGNEKNGQKRIKPVSDDGTSKKPRKNAPEAAGMKEERNENKHCAIDSSVVEESYLTISNLPSDWTYGQIKKYLEEECIHVDMLKQGDLQNCTVKLTFQGDSAKKCKDAFKKLKNKVVQDKNLEVVMTEPSTTYSPGNNTSSEASGQSDVASDTPEIIPQGPWRPDRDMWETDPQGLYGLRPQFLKSLNITTPLDRWVHVSNFRCDKTELKEVMELAGNVLMCCVVTIMNKYAMVQYSHPLEAVQAISMLDGQTFYGIPLKVKIYRNPKDSIILPKGLANIGLGLGIQGRPIHNIAQQYQRYARKQSSLINPIVFSEINVADDDSRNICKPEDEDEIQRKINDFMNMQQNCNMPNQSSFKVKNVDELEHFEMNPKDGSNRSTPDKNAAKTSPAPSRKTSIGPISPNQAPQTKDDVGAPTNNLVKSLLGPIQIPNALGSLVPIRLTNQNPREFPRPGLLKNPAAPLRNPLPVPTPGHTNYRPGPINFPNQPRPMQFGPRPMMGPAFGPQPMPAPFGPAPGIRPQMSPANFRGTRPFGGPTPAPCPNLNPVNRVTVNIFNLPPSTTFRLLCDKLTQFGQVMSVQLTTPGCAVATFGHPSHAEICIQTLNRMSIEGYIIEVKYA